MKHNQMLFEKLSSIESASNEKKPPSNKIITKKTASENKSKEESEALRREILENNGIENDQVLKMGMCKWVKLISTFYLIFVGITIWLCGNARVSNLNYISDSVLIALLTTTTITIIGLPALILHSLFPKDKNKKYL
jgi:hypothetical protein